MTSPFKEAYDALAAAENAFARECVRVHAKTALKNCMCPHRDTPVLAKLRKALKKASAAYLSAWKATGRSTISPDDAAIWDTIGARRLH